MKILIFFSWVLGIMAMLFLFLSYQQKKRRSLLLCKLSADICWSIHYLIIGAYGGVIPNTVGIVREIVFINRNKMKWADNKIWPIVFIIFNAILGFATLSNAINILPIFASSMVTVSLWLKNPTVTKIISLPVCIMFFIYDKNVTSYVGMINDIISFLSICINFIKNFEKETR